MSLLREDVPKTWPTAKLLSPNALCVRLTAHDLSVDERQLCYRALRNGYCYISYAKKNSDWLIDWLIAFLSITLCLCLSLSDCQSVCNSVHCFAHGQRKGLKIMPNVFLAGNFIFTFLDSRMMYRLATIAVGCTVQPPHTAKKANGRNFRVLNRVVVGRLILQLYRTSYAVKGKGTV